MGNLEMEQDLELTLKLNLELLESFSVQTYHPSAGTVAAADAVVLDFCILSGALSHQRNLLLSEVMYWQCSFCLDLWKKTGSVG